MNVMDSFQINRADTTHRLKFNCILELLKLYVSELPAIALQIFECS